MIKFYSKKIIGLLLLIAIVIGMTVTLYPKYMYYLDTKTPEKETFHSFYSQKKNSIDVIFAGSSHIYNGINPVLFYEETGLTAFDTAYSSCDMGTAYYVLADTFLRQSPKYVVLDCYYASKGVFFNGSVYERIANNMKWSSVKKDFIDEWVSRDTSGIKKLVNNIIPLLSYHTRWEEVTQEDFEWIQYDYSVQGYIPCGTMEEYDRSGYTKNENYKGIPDETEEYIKKIKKLCDDNGAELILTTLPYEDAVEKMTEDVQQLADEMNVSFIDYNTESNFESLGIDLEKDFLNSGHLNSYGSVKMTSALAKWMKNNWDLQSAYSEDRSIQEQWQELSDEWSRDEEMYKLLRCNDLSTYLTLLQDDRYTVMMTCTKNGKVEVDSQQKKMLKKLGISYDIGMNKKSYAGVYFEGNAVKQAHGDAPEVQGATKQISYYVSAEKSNASVYIDGENYAIENKEGLGFVVYDNTTKRVVDSVVFRNGKMTR